MLCFPISSQKAPGRTLATFRNGKMPLHHLENGMGNAKEFRNGQEDAKREQNCCCFSTEA